MHSKCKFASACAQASFSSIKASTAFADFATQNSGYVVNKEDFEVICCDASKLMEDHIEVVFLSFR